MVNYSHRGGYRSATFALLAFALVLIIHGLPSYLVADGVHASVYIDQSLEVRGIKNSTPSFESIYGALVGHTKNDIASIKTRSSKVTKRQTPLCDDCWKSAVSTGCALLSSMTSPLEAAGGGVLLQSPPPQSTFTADGNTLLTSYGWQRSREASINLAKDPPLEKTLRAKGIEVDFGPPAKWTRWDHVAWRHVNSYQDPNGGGHKPPSFASFRWFMNSQDGIIMTHYMFALNLKPPERNPDLRTWSDVTFLEWYTNQVKNAPIDGKGPIPAPNLIIIPQIVNEESAQIISSVLKRTKQLLNDWPGSTYSTDTDEGKALLSTPNSKAIAWFLITHKVWFGLKKISQVTIFRPIDEKLVHPYLAFTVVDVLQ